MFRAVTGSNLLQEVDLTVVAKRVNPEIQKIKRGEIGSKFEVPIDLDSGARLCFMGKAHYMQYRGHPGNHQEPLPLKWPIRIKVANKRYEYSRSYLRETLTIHSPTGKIILENVVFYIVDATWDDVLIGWPILEFLGLTPEQNISKHVGKTFSITEEEQHLIAIGDGPTKLLSEAAKVNTEEVLSEMLAANQAGILDDTTAEKLLTFPALDWAEANKSDVYVTMDFDWKALGATTTHMQHMENNPDEAYENQAFEEPGILDFKLKDTNPEEFEAMMTSKLEEAKRNGCKNMQKLEQIIRSKQCFALNFEECSVSKLTPMVPELKEGVEPCTAKPRRMSWEQLKWLKAHVETMVQLKMLKKVDNPVWGIPVFVVKKPGGGWRMVADFRALNSRSRPTSLPMPLLEQLVESLHGASVFGKFDNMKGFNLLKATRNELFTLVTPFGCYEMLVAPMGYLNSPATYQDRIVNEVLEGLHMEMCVNWIDDLLVFGPDEETYLDRLDKILSRYDKWGVKLSLEKCEFFTKQVEWCGREFSNGTWCFSSKYYDKVLKTPEPETALELADFIYALQWVQTTLNPLGILEAKNTLNEVLNKVFKKKAPKSHRKKKLLVGAKLKEYGWGNIEKAAFQRCLKILHEAIKLAVVNPIKALCLFTDASQFVGCSIIVTQVDPKDLSKPLKEQQHELVFLTTHKWSESEMDWHISSKEAYPVIFALERLNYLFAGKKIHIFMDHKTLEFVFNPDQTTPKTTLMRLQRWALILQSHWYQIKHIKGDTNVMADVWSRWGLAQSRQICENVTAKASRILRNLQAFNEPGVRFKPVAQNASRRTRLRFDTSTEEAKSNKDMVIQPNQLPVDYESMPIRPNIFRDKVKRTDPSSTTSGIPLEVPTLDTICQAQQCTKEKPPQNAFTREGILYVNGKIWVPKEILWQVIAIMHVEMGHPGIESQVEILQRKFWSKKLREYASQMNKFCLICLGEHTPRAIRRKIGEQFHAIKRNQVLHMDFLYIKDKEYCLLIRDDLSGKTEMFYMSSADAVSACEAINWWKARYGMRKDTVIITDGGSHFANSLVRELIQKLGVRHHITVAYSPWSNGVAERVNREVLKTMRLILSQLAHKNLKHWKDILPQVQYLINNTPRKRLGGKTHDEVFLINIENGPMDMVFINKKEYTANKIPVPERELRETLNELDKVMREIHKEVVNVQSIQRNHLFTDKKNRGIENIQYAIGDWVLVSRATRRPNKLMSQWTGPYQVIDTISPWVYRVRAVTGKCKNVHSVRIRFYEYKYWLKQEEIQNFAAKGIKGFEIEEIRDSRWNAKEKHYELLCSWWGLEKEQDSWLPFEEVQETDPDVLDRYLLTTEHTEVVKILLKKRNL